MCVCLCVSVHAQVHTYNQYDASVFADLMASDSEVPQLAAVEDSDEEDDSDWEPEMAAGMNRFRLFDQHDHKHSYSGQMVVVCKTNKKRLH